MKIKINNPFISTFKDELLKVKNQDYLIQNEINQIEAFTSSNTQFTKIDKLGLKGNKTNSVFDLSLIGSRDRFNNVFHEFLKYDICELNDCEKNNTTLKTIYDHAKNFAEYYNWLKDYKTKPNTLKKYTDLTNEQKLLALHFLIPNLSDYTNTQLCKVLGQILNIGTEPIRINLSKVHAGKNEIKNKENFEKLMELFDNKTFESITNKLKREIKEVS